VNGETQRRRAVAHVPLAVQAGIAEPARPVDPDDRVEADHVVDLLHQRAGIPAAEQPDSPVTDVDVDRKRIGRFSRPGDEPREVTP
jgi:hypothetical protein